MQIKTELSVQTNVASGFSYEERSKQIRAKQAQALQAGKPPLALPGESDPKPR
jgi:hypothetical protein